MRKLDSQKLNNFLKATQLVSGRSGILTHRYLTPEIVLATTTFTLVLFKKFLQFFTIKYLIAWDYDFSEIVCDSWHNLNSGL